MQQIEVPGSGSADVANGAIGAAEAPAAPAKPRHRSPEAMKAVRRHRRPAGAPVAASGERAPLPTEEAPPEATGGEADPLPNFVNGIRIPHGAVAYRVARYDDGRTKRVKEYCTLTPPGMSEAIEFFPLSTPEGGPIAPDWHRVLQIWGSGFYAFQWLKSGNAWGGWSERKRLDDGRFPPMPAHRKIEAQAAAAPAPAPASVAAAPLEPMAAIVNALAATGGGKIDASVAIALMMMVNQMNASTTSALEARQRQWRLEDEERARERDREHERRLERERTFAAEDRNRITAFYTTARAQEAAGAGDDRIRRLEEKLEDALDLLDEQGEPEAAPEKSLTDQALEQFLPVMAARLGASMMAPAPTPPGSDGSKS